MSACALHVCLLHNEIRRECQIPWDYIDGCEPPVELNPGPWQKEVSALNHTAIFPASKVTFSSKMKENCLANIQGHWTLLKRFKQTKITQKFKEKTQF